jgi:hypothetical protein
MLSVVTFLLLLMITFVEKQFRKLLLKKQISHSGRIDLLTIRDIFIKHYLLYYIFTFCYTPTFCTTSRQNLFIHYRLQITLKSSN